MKIKFNRNRIAEEKSKSKYKKHEKLIKPSKNPVEHLINKMDHVGNTNMLLEDKVE